jgi:hypothetical protein
MEALCMPSSLIIHSSMQISDRTVSWRETSQRTCDVLAGELFSFRNTVLYRSWHLAEKSVHRPVITCSCVRIHFFKCGLKWRGCQNDEECKGSLVRNRMSRCMRPKDGFLILSASY